MSDLSSARRVFVSYSHADSKALKLLFRYLEPHRRQGELTLWADTKIGFGEGWREEIDRAMREAELAVLLISQDFLASKFIAEVEVPLLLRRHEAGEVKILPVFWSTSTVGQVEFGFETAKGEWTSARLSALQGFNSPDSTLDLLPLPRRKKAFAQLVEKILAGARKEPAPSPDLEGESSPEEDHAARGGSSSGEGSTEAYEVFVSFAEPDRAYAMELAQQLTQQGRSVFVADDAAAAGSVLDEHLSAAVYRSGLVAVILSERSDRARYPREDIQLAIELQRAERLQIAPIYVDGPPPEPRDWECGLRRFQRLDLRQLGIEETADRIGDRLAEESLSKPAPPEPTTNSVLHQTIGDVMHGAALRIDRTQQWLPLVKICRSGDNALFLLHGPRQQYLDLFIARVWRFLNDECERHQDVVVVPRRIEFSIPRSEFEWENHLRYGLAGESGQAGTAEDLLRERARFHPVFLVLSRLPIARRHPERYGGLSEDELEAFVDFLSGPLPALIRRASKGGHPIRALVATHYETEEDSLVDSLRNAALLGCRNNGVRFRKLAPVQPLEWSDIEDYLDSFRTPPPDRIYREMRMAFERLRAAGDRSFRKVLEMLAQLFD